MAEPSQKFLVKILSGNHVGAEMELPSGSTIIGSGGSADVVLTDTLIAPSHLQLDVDDGQVFAIPLAQPTHLSGEEIVEKAEVSNFSIITMGTTHIAIGQGKTKWPDLELPDLSVIATAKSVPVQEVEETENVEGEEEQPEESLEPEEAPEVKKNKSSWKKRFLIAFLFLSLIGVSVAVTLYYYYYAMANDKPKEKPQLTSQEQHFQNIEKILDKQGLNQLRISEEMGVTLISGLVEDDRQIKELESSTRALDFQVVVSVTTQKRFLEQCYNLAENIGVFLKARTRPDGMIQLYLYALNSTKLRSAKSALDSILPKNHQVTLKIYNEKQILSIIENIFRSANLQQFIRVEGNVQDNSIVLKGFVLSENSDQWLKAKQEFAEKLSGLPIEYSSVFVAKEEDLEVFFFGSSISSIQLGKVPWLETVSGKIFFQGITLKTDWVLKSISMMKISLTNGKIRIILTPNV